MNKKIRMRSALIAALLTLMVCEQTSLYAATTPATPVNADKADKADKNSPAQKTDSDSDGVVFDPSLLAGGSSSVDLSRFSHGNPVLPGNYIADIYLNGNWIAKRSVHFASASSKKDAVPCFNSSLVKLLNIATTPASALINAARLTNTSSNTHASSTSSSTTTNTTSSLHISKDMQASQDALKNSKEASATQQTKSNSSQENFECTHLTDLVPDATYTFDISTQRLDLSIPQAFLINHPSGYVDLDSLDSGMNAGFVNYDSNVFRSIQKSNAQNSYFLGLNSGINIGQWRLRNTSNLTQNTGQRFLWDNSETYAERNLTGLKAQLRLGDVYTDGTMFTSFKLRGVHLYSDQNMLPQSRRGFAPAIRGIARTNAKVTIRRNGMIVKETSVSPGPFVIQDIYPQGYGGDLFVTITEADGSTRTFTVPYASVPGLLRPGVTEFDLATGRFQNDFVMDQRPYVAQASIHHGLNNLFSAYGGMVGDTQNYFAGMLGSAMNTDVGAFSLDVTQAHSGVKKMPSSNGYSTRLSYSNSLPNVGTNISLAAYRYSANYLDLTQAAFLNGGGAALASTQSSGSPYGGFNPNDPLGSIGEYGYRNRAVLNLSQSLGKVGSLSLTASSADYWNRAGKDTQYELSFSSSFHNLSYSVSAMRTRSLGAAPQNQLFVSMSIPLGKSEDTHSLFLTNSFTKDSEAGNSFNSQLSGSAGLYNQFSYGIGGSRDMQQNVTTGNLSASYAGSQGAMNAGYTYGTSYSQASLGASGSVLFHSHGVTFGQRLSDTSALVHLDNAKHTTLQNAPGVEFDRRGYALIPSLTPYEINHIALTPNSLPLGIQLNETSTDVAPTKGAIVGIDFKSQGVSGRSGLIKVTLPDQKPLPFGAAVYDTTGKLITNVAQGGRIFSSDLKDSGTLQVKWGQPELSCTLHYKLPIEEEAYANAQAVCEPDKHSTLVTKKDKESTK